MGTVCGYVAAGTLTLADLQAASRRQWNQDSVPESERQLTSSLMVSYYAGQTRPRRLPAQLTRLVARFSGSDWRPEYGDLLTLGSADGLVYTAISNHPGVFSPLRISSAP